MTALARRRRVSLSDLIREATWCVCTNHTVEQGEAMRAADALEAEVERLLAALIAMDDAVCHGNPETAKRFAREAYNRTTERVET